MESDGELQEIINTLNKKNPTPIELIHNIIKMYLNNKKNIIKLDNFNKEIIKRIEKLENNRGLNQKNKHEDLIDLDNQIMDGNNIISEFESIKIENNIMVKKGPNDWSNAFINIKILCNKN